MVCGTGGWDPTVLPGSAEAMGSHCDLLEIWGLDRLPDNPEFMAKYINTGTPVVFRGVARQGSEIMHNLLVKFAKDRFLKKYGAIEVAASVLPYGDSFGVQTLTKTLREAATSSSSSSSSAVLSEEQSMQNASQSSPPPLYVFQTPGPQWFKQIIADVPVPRSLTTATIHPETGGVEKRDYEHELQFYLGSAGTGAPVHIHGHAINTLAYGEKQWVLFPPADAFYSTIPARQFFERYVWNQTNPSTWMSTLLEETSPDARQEKREMQMLRCTQHAGDIMYVPSLWAHGTLNVRQSIGVAHEFSVEPFCME